MDSLGGTGERDRQVRRVIVIEALANVAVLGTKATVGVATGSSAILGDALHSLTDLANNGVAWLAMRVAAAPPDREHPYGHHKFETLAVFGLATLLSVLAIELALRSISRGPYEVQAQGWSLALMLGVLTTNVLLSWWENGQAQRLQSDLLGADARHTFSDVLTTLAVIAGWQFAARGYPWLDTAATLLVAGLILYLAYGLFRRAIPVLVDQSLADPAELSAVVDRVEGVRSTRQVRSRGLRGEARIDVVVSVDPELSTRESHRIADEIEETLLARFDAEDVFVHVEPDLGHERGKR